ncbi:hypothetical protein LJR290_000102 [Variovorax sp. LjRoot290]
MPESVAQWRCVAFSQVNLTPPQYRRRFGGLRAVLSVHGNA